MILQHKFLKLAKLKFNNMVGCIRSLVLISTSILGGICLFLLAAIIFINSSILNPEFQKNLLHKSNAYIYIDNTVKDTINDFIGSLPLENELLDMLTVSYMRIDNQVFEESVDSLVEGLLEYLKGQSNVLPDIYIGNQFLTMPTMEINKLNLGSILLYFNKSYIIDMLIVIRQILKLFKPTPFIILLLIILLAGFSAIYSSNTKSFIMWWKKFFLSSGIISAIIGFCIYICSNNLQENSSIFNAILLHFGEGVTNIILSYMDNLLGYMLRTAVIYTAFSTLLSCILSAINKQNRYPASENKEDIMQYGKGPASPYRQAALVVILLMTLPLAQNVYRLGKNYSMLSPGTALSRIYNYGSISEVISAVDDTVYSLELKVSNDKTGEPVPGIKVYVIQVDNHDTITNVDANMVSSVNTGFNTDIISGMDSLRTYLEADTDDNGTANIILDKGLYKLELYPYEDAYILPQSFMVDIKLAGKNTIYLNVSPNEE